MIDRRIAKLEKEIENLNKKLTKVTFLGIDKDDLIKNQSGVIARYLSNMKHLTKQAEENPGLSLFDILNRNKKEKPETPLSKVSASLNELFKQQAVRMTTDTSTVRAFLMNNPVSALSEDDINIVVSGTRKGVECGFDNLFFSITGTHRSLNEDDEMECTVYRRYHDAAVVRYENEFLFT